MQVLARTGSSCNILGTRSATQLFGQVAGVGGWGGKGATLSCFLCFLPWWLGSCEEPKKKLGVWGLGVGWGLP